MIYYKKCTVRFSSGREITYENFQGKTQHDWGKYLVDLRYNLSNADIFLSDEIIPEDKLISVPRRII